MLRPSFAALSRSIQASLSTSASSAFQPAARNAAFSTLRNVGAIPNSNMATQSMRKSQSLLQQGIRGVRTSPFRGGAKSDGSLLSLPHAAPSGPSSISQPGGWQRALTSVGLIAGTALVANFVLNRPSREAPMSAFSQDYLRSTFGYLGTGLSLTAAGAVMLHRSGFSYRLMATSPWLVLGVGLVASIGGMIGARSLEPGHPGKTACWLLFNASQAAVLSPLMFFNPALLARAGLYTAGIVGSLSYVAATAKDGQFLWMGGPLLAGVTVVALSSLAPMVLPSTAVRALAATEALSLYGGLAVFGGFVLWDTQKIIAHSKQVEMGARRHDPLAESIGLELDFINIFIRIVQILAMQQNRRK